MLIPIFVKTTRTQVRKVQRERKRDTVVCCIRNIQLKYAQFSSNESSFRIFNHHAALTSCGRRFIKSNINAVIIIMIAQFRLSRFLCIDLRGLFWLMLNETNKSQTFRREMNINFCCSNFKRVLLLLRAGNCILSSSNFCQNNYLRY